VSYKEVDCFGYELLIIRSAKSVGILFGTLSRLLVRSAKSVVFLSYIARLFFGIHGCSVPIA